MATRPRPALTDEEIILELRRRAHTIRDNWVRLLVPGRDAESSRELDDVREVGERLIAVLLRALGESRDFTAGETDFMRSYLRRALLRGASEAELVRGAQLLYRVTWDEVEGIAGPAGAATVTRVARPLIALTEYLSAEVLDATAEIQAALRLTAREGRREVVQALISGAVDARHETAIRAAGLGDAPTYIVVSARPVAPLPEASAAQVAIVALAHAAGDAVEPLYAVLDEELVVIRASTIDDVRSFADGLADARTKLARDGVELAVGVSTLHGDLAEVPSAHHEAGIARERAGAGEGLVAFPLLTPLQYLLVRGGDRAAWSLVPARIREFVERDLSEAGLLLETLDAYIACSLNTKAAAERLFVHTNTARYRIAKIEASTGLDLRDIADLTQLAIAVAIARHRAGGAGSRQA